MRPYTVLPTGQRKYEPEMKFDVARDGKRMHLSPSDTGGLVFSRRDIVEHWIQMRRWPSANLTIVEVEPYIEPESYVRLRATVRAGMIVENCSCQAVEVKSVNYDDGHMKCVSIHNGQNSNCDLYHCGIVPLTPEGIERKIAIYAAAGSDDAGRKALAADWRRRMEIEDES